MIKIAELGLDNGVIFKDLIFTGTASELHSKMEAEYPITFTLNNSQSLTVYSYKISHVILDEPNFAANQSQHENIHDFIRKYFSAVNK